VNTSDLSTGSKLLLGASAVLFIDLFLSWQKICIDFAGVDGTCGTASGWRGIGVLVGLLAIAVIAWEVAQMTGNAPQLPIPAALLSAALGAGVAVFGLLEFLTHNEARHWPAWIGLVCFVVIAIGAFRRFTEAGGAAAIPRQSSVTPSAPSAPADPAPPVTHDPVAPPAAEPLAGGYEANNPPPRGPSSSDV
jgi:hypothetical protein